MENYSTSKSKKISNGRKLIKTSFALLKLLLSERESETNQPSKHEQCATRNSSVLCEFLAHFLLDVFLRIPSESLDQLIRMEMFTTLTSSSKTC